MCRCTSVLSGLTKTLCAPVVPLAGASIRKAAPTAWPVSASTAVAGTLTTTRCCPATLASTLRLKLPAASLLPETGSPVSQALLLLTS